MKHAHPKLWFLVAAYFMNACVTMTSGGLGSHSGLGWTLSGAYQHEEGLYAGARVSNQRDELLALRAGNVEEAVRAPGVAAAESLACQVRGGPRLEASGELLVMKGHSHLAPDVLAKREEGLTLGLSGSLAKRGCGKTAVVGADLRVPLEHPGSGASQGR